MGFSEQKRMRAEKKKIDNTDDLRNKCSVEVDKQFRFHLLSLGFMQY